MADNHINSETNGTIADNHIHILYLAKPRQVEGVRWREGKADGDCRAGQGAAVA